MMIAVYSYFNTMLFFLDIEAGMTPTINLKVQNIHTHPVAPVVATTTKKPRSEHCLCYHQNMFRATW
jgi:hypothetical protein